MIQYPTILSTTILSKGLKQANLRILVEIKIIMIL